MRTRTRAADLLAGTTCLILLAQEPRPPAGGGLAEGFRQLDRNGDAKLTRDETGGAAWLDTLDLNRDGFITRTEAATAARIEGKGPLRDEVVQAVTYRKDSTGPTPLSDSKTAICAQSVRG